MRLARLRRRVRIALRCADGERGSISEQRLVDAYDALVSAEPRREWPA